MHETDHDRYNGLDYFVMQAKWGLREGATGVHYRDKYAVHYIWSLVSHDMKNVQIDGLAVATPRVLSTGGPCRSQGAVDLGAPLYHFMYFHRGQASAMHFRSIECGTNVGTCSRGAPTPGP